MNVNLWGPQLWEILHGISGMTKPPKSKCAQEIFAGLKVLLPCIHCRKSYVEFYDSFPSALEAFKDANSAMKWTYDIHNRVNEKLETQRMKIYVEGVGGVGNGSVGSIPRKEVFALNHRPSFEVVKKRFLLSDGKPFHEDSVWRVLISFSLNSDLAADKNLAALKEWLKNLIDFISIDDKEIATPSYKNLIEKLPVLYGCDMQTSKEFFCASILVQYGKLTNSKDFRLVQSKEQALLLRKWELTKSLLPASGCSTSSCQ